ncbi:MAG: YjbE family putative metal transport protein [Minisyncoccota bacterium]
MTEFFALVQIIAIDALMAADNAIVVGMAAASVPADKRKKVIVFGTMAAVVLRIAFALVAVQLLKIIGLTFAGGLLLAYVSYDMYRELRRGSDEALAATETKSDMSFLRAVGLIVAADLSMSLDNVLAVAGAANGHLGLLVTGLLISVTLMAVAASFLASVIQKHRWVAWLGLFMVAYVALGMIYRGANEVVAATVAFL